MVVASYALPILLLEQFSFFSGFVRPYRELYRDLLCKMSGHLSREDVRNLKLGEPPINGIFFSEFLGSIPLLNPEILGERWLPL